VSKSDKANISEQIAESIKRFSQWAKDDPARARTSTIEMPDFIQQKAALISAHFLLPAGARIVDMGCETGEVAYVLAQLNPRAEIIGVDNDARAIEFASKNYKLPNLSFRKTDITLPDMEDESIDGIVNSNILHGVYSDAGFNNDEIDHLLEKQAHKLKPGGVMLIRDYMMPATDEFVLLKMPNVHSKGKTPALMSDADLLVSFSHTARPLLAGQAEGFALEELPPKHPDTRLFRLPHKWAVEFVHRKNYRDGWIQGLKEEYTFYTLQDYTRECSKIGMRMVFSAPYSNPWIVKKHFKGSFQLYSEDGRPMPYPATNYFIVAQKVADKQSLLLEERRPSQVPVGDLQVMVVRDKKSGKLHELVKRPGEHCDIVPYRITPDNRLVVYVRSGYPRPIINAGARGRHNLDGKKWSGHLVEPISMATVSMSDDIEANRQMIFDFTRNYATLRPKSESAWHLGETFFPAPDLIDEAIEAVYIEVENPAKVSWPIHTDQDTAFTELGKITELDGADIILASQVGLLPEPRLELHVLDLMRRNGIQPPRWIGEVMPKIARQSIRAADPETVLKEAEPTTFEEERKGENIHLKPVKAVFIEEGKVGRQTRGLSAQDVEYILSDDGVENIALVLPVSRDWDNNLLVALQPQIMPVPNRIGTDGAQLNAPSFPLPKDVRTIDDAKMFIASKFKVDVEQVAQMGASFFTHVGVTPQRVYPFMVASAAEANIWGIRYMLESNVVALIFMFNRTYSLGMQTIKAVARMSMMMNDSNLDMGMKRDPSLQKYQGYSLSTEKVAVESINAGYSSIPSRILGQRGPVGGSSPETIAPQQPPAQSATAAPKQPPADAGKKLSQSYAQTKVQMKQTPGMSDMGHSVEVISKSLEANKAKPAVTETPAPDTKKLKNEV
jgi:SAM-dependent methyltransferase